MFIETVDGSVWTNCQIAVAADSGFDGAANRPCLSFVVAYLSGDVAALAVDWIVGIGENDPVSFATFLGAQSNDAGHANRFGK